MVLSNIFGEIYENAVTFVIDTSLSMEGFLPIIRNHLDVKLSELALRKPKARFNVILSNSKHISKWSNEPVECSPNTISSAMRWVSNARCRKDKCLLKAVRAAGHGLEVGGSIILVLNGIADENLRDHCFVHPVHCLYLTFDKDRIPNEEDVFCEDLASSSRGSFHLIFLTHKGQIRKTIEAYNHCKQPADIKMCSVRTSLSNPVLARSLTPPPAPVLPIPVPAYYPYIRPLSSVDIAAMRDEFHKTPVASVVARGTRVFARREDGFYYRGFIAQEIEDCQSAFMIEFDKTRRGPELRMEKVPLHDIIALHDAERHSIVPGDKVLAQWSNARSRFGPGDVLSGVENRRTIGDKDDQDIVVAFWNGKTEKVCKGRAVWVPGPLYDRIVTELQMPMSARKSLLDFGKVAQKPTQLSIYDDILEVPFLDPLYRGPYSVWWNSGYYYLPTYPLMTCVPTYLRSWPFFLHRQPHLLYERYPNQYKTNTVHSSSHYPVEQPDISDCSDNESERDCDDVDIDMDRLAITKDSSSSSSSSSSEDEDDFYLKCGTKLSQDVGTNTEYILPARYGKQSSFVRKEREPRPEWKKYWPQTPQPRWRPRRGKLDYDDFQPHHACLDEYDFSRSMDVADCKRLKTLMRIRSDVEKQRKYEEQIQNTINAKGKISQEFRNRFYEKEMEHLNRRNNHQRWLQERRQKYVTDMVDRGRALDEKSNLVLLGRQARQRNHYFRTADAADAYNYDAALRANRKAQQVNRRAQLLDMETRRY